MKAKPQMIDETEAINEKLLMSIAQNEKDIKLTRESLRRLEDQYKTRLEEAIEKKIERAGEYKLVCKPIIRRSVDLEAVKTLLTTDQILSICTITLIKAEQYVTKKQLEACTTKTASSTYKVIECYEPGGKTA